MPTQVLKSYSAQAGQRFPKRRAAHRLHGTMTPSLERIFLMANLVRTLACLALLAGSSAAAGQPTLSGAWARATPPGVRTGAAYLTIAAGDVADKLLGASTPSARAVEIHTHVVEGGLQRMVGVAELALHAGETVRLEPGGLHLMLIDLAAPLTPGETVTLSLRFAAAGTVELEVPVIDARSSPPPSHAAH
jgi:copper(I)-binding protein